MEVSYVVKKTKRTYFVLQTDLSHVSAISIWYVLVRVLSLWHSSRWRGWHANEKQFPLTFVTSVTPQSLLLPRTSLGDSFWTRYDFIHITIYWLTTRIRARNSRNTSNAPSWYMLRLITSSAGSISHFIWTLKTQPLLLSLASPTSPWSAFDSGWWCRWCVFSSRDCSHLTLGFIKLMGKVL